MWTQAGFTVDCKTNTDAIQTAEKMKAFLKTKELSNDNSDRAKTHYA